MSAKELSIEAQNKIIKIQQLAERGEITIPEYHEQLRALGLHPEEAELGLCDPDVKTGNRVGRFMLFLRKAKHTLTDESHYYLILTWEEIQALIDTCDDLSGTYTEHVDFNKLASKLSEQLKWQAEGPR